jgi:3D (Asp-Asp-Asp) domain-containing protein
MRRGLGVVVVFAFSALTLTGVALGLTGGTSSPPRHRRGTVVPARLVYKHGQTGRAVEAHGARCRSGPPPVPEHPLRRRQWLTGVVITEYYPAPERWFVGRRVSAPGLGGTYAVDWLYSAHGVAMEGDGVDRHGRRVHISDLGTTGWVNAAGGPTLAICLGQWTAGPPAWLRGGWRNQRGAVTFRLATGGWSNGRGVRELPYGGVAFSPGPSLPLRYYHSLAVDPRLIPLGSRVYIPAYRDLGGGWFLAQDTGGAIKGRHVDVYRSPPSNPADLGRYLTGQRIFVIPPG